ncbi:MAG: DUF424 family protein [Hadesarchaea archaeon]|nr:DUF424 family protein [Hadesarchaea archaeon]
MRGLWGPRFGEERLNLPLLKTIRTQGEVLVIVCDAELLGKKFKQGKFKLEVKKSFYDGEETSVEECISALRGATIANLVGSIVGHAVKAGIIERKNVLHFQKVQHAQLVRI